MLGKFEWEVLDYMPANELIRWMALSNLEAKERKREASKPKSKVVRRR